MIGQRTALFLLIAVETAAFGIFSETILFPAAVLLAATVGWQGGWRAAVPPDRRVIATLVAALVFALKWRIDPHTLSDDVMSYLSPFLHSVGQFLLVLQTAALYLAHDRGVLPVLLPWPGVFVMFSAGDRSVNPAERLTYQAFALAFVAATALYFSATARAASRRPAGVMRPGKAVVAAAVLAVVLVGGWASAAGLRRYERALDEIVSELLTPSYDASAAGFPTHSRLGSISKRKNERAADVALRVYSTAEPGYLRGKAYHWLTDDRAHRRARARSVSLRWDETPPGLVLNRRPDDARFFPFDEADDDRFRYRLTDRPLGAAAEKMEFWIGEPLWGLYFLPLGAGELTTSEEELRRDFREISGASALPAANYAVRTGPRPNHDRYFDLSPAATGPFSRAALTAFPDDAADAADMAEAAAIADRVFAGCRTVPEHLAAVEAYFRENYEYAVGIEVPPGVDPLLHFLTRKPAAHCEFFAQGAALLLRMRGIPTRYMTGFVAAERNDLGGYWLARNEHAHAWCEAWVDGVGWTVVEATPAAGVPQPAVAPRHRQLWDYLTGRIAQFRARFAAGGWRWLLGVAVGFLLSPAGGVTLAAVVAYVAFRLRRRRSESDGLPPAVVELHRLLGRMDRRVARAGLERRPGETLHGFAARVAPVLPDGSAEWYADYAAARYRRADLPAADALRARLDRLPPMPRLRVARARHATAMSS